MKKLLGILVLGLLWCNTAFAESSLPACHPDQGDDHKKWTNCSHGWNFGDGNTYFGEWKDGQPHGVGEFNLQDGGKYVGEFKDGMFHGTGTLNLKDGTVATGEFKNNDMHGKATFHFSDGGKYVGEFKNGEAHGKGIYTSPDGSAVARVYELGKIIEEKAISAEQVAKEQAEQKAKEKIAREKKAKEKLAREKAERFSELNQLRETAKFEPMIFTKLLREATDSNNHLCSVKQKDYFLDATMISFEKKLHTTNFKYNYESVEDLIGDASALKACRWYLANLEQTVILRETFERKNIKYEHKLDKRVFEFEDPRQIVFDYLDDYYSVKIETDSEYKLLEHLNFDYEYFLIFAEHKILSIDEFEKIKAEAKATEIDCTVRTEQFKDGFCKSITDPLDGFYIPSFLELKKESTKRGLPITKIIKERYKIAKKYEKKLEKEKKIRDAAIKKEREEYEAARKKEREEYAKKYPFYAKIECSAGGGIQYISFCLTDDYGGGGSSIRLRTSDSLLETSFMHILQNNPPFGRLIDNGAVFFIDLPYKYKLAAQMGGRDYGSLTIKIFDRVTKSLIYTSNASTRFAVATASN